MRLIMKLLAVCSTQDLRFRFGCTSAWWQLCKGLYEVGADVIAVPYQGRAIESLWWRVYENPCAVEGEAFAAVRNLGRRAFGRRNGLPATGRGMDRLVNLLVANWIRPRWEAHLRAILQQERDVAAVLVLGVPVNHLRGLPARLRRDCGVPFYYYDGDVPASLPRFGGFASGFHIYEGADPGEYDGFICNSVGGAAELGQLGARRVQVLHWGVDPELYAPLPVDQDLDLFFYGYGHQYRTEWMEKMLGQPTRARPELRAAVGGLGFEGVDLGRAERVGDVPFSSFRRFCGRSRLNLNITRRAHASVYASSSLRPFELAAMGCCIVSNPVAGLEEWFRPGEEVFVVQDEQETLDLYPRLLADPAERREAGRRARARVLAEHTVQARARDLLRILAGETGAPPGPTASRAGSGAWPGEDSAAAGRGSRRP